MADTAENTTQDEVTDHQQPLTEFEHTASDPSTQTSSMEQSAESTHDPTSPSATDLSAPSSIHSENVSHELREALESEQIFNGEGEEPSVPAAAQPASTRARNLSTSSGDASRQATSTPGDTYHMTTLGLDSCIESTFSENFVDIVYYKHPVHSAVFVAALLLAYAVVFFDVLVSPIWLAVFLAKWTFAALFALSTFQLAWNRFISPKAPLVLFEAHVTPALDKAQATIASFSDTSVLQQLMDAVMNYSRSALAAANSAVRSGDIVALARCLVVAQLLQLVFSYMTLRTLGLIVIIGTFSVPKLYKTYKTPIDTYSTMAINPVMSQVSKLTGWKPKSD